MDCIRLIDVYTCSKMWRIAVAPRYPVASLVISSALVVAQVLLLVFSTVVQELGDACPHDSMRPRDIRPQGWMSLSPRAWATFRQLAAGQGNLSLFSSTHAPFVTLRRKWRQSLGSTTRCGNTMAGMMLIPLPRYFMCASSPTQPPFLLLGH